MFEVRQLYGMFQVSNVAATGMFDPFTMSYAGWVFNIFNIPGSLLFHFHYNQLLSDLSLSVTEIIDSLPFILS